MQFASMAPSVLHISAKADALRSLRADREAVFFYEAYREGAC